MLEDVDVPNQKGSGAHSKLQSKEYQSPVVRTFHKDTREKVTKLGAKV